MKDIFMYLIQKQKFKKYGQDDWFQLVNAIHQFLVNLDINEQSSTSDTIKLDKRDNDYTVSYFENELRSYKEQNKTLFEMIEEKKSEIGQVEQDSKRVKDEN
jgi:hypothetical protein